MPPIVEYPDGLDFEIGGNANKVGPGISDNDNPEKLLDTIDMNHMRIQKMPSMNRFGPWLRPYITSMCRYSTIGNVP